MIPLRVKYIPTDNQIPENKEEGMLYFVEAQNTIYKDGVIPFSGINNVTFVTTDTATEIRFNTDGNTDGNAGKLVVGNNNLIDLVKTLNERLTDAEKAIDKINLTKSVIFNVDTLNPKSTPYTLKEAIDYISTVANAAVANAAVLFNDGNTTRMYFFTSTDPTLFSNVDYWQEVQLGSGKEVQCYQTRSAFPPVGQPNILYIDTESDETFFWDDNSIQYRQCGFNPLNIKFIDSNFK